MEQAREDARRRAEKSLNRWEAPPPAGEAGSCTGTTVALRNPSRSAAIRQRIPTTPQVSTSTAALCPWWAMGERSPRSTRRRPRSEMPCVDSTHAVSMAGHATRAAAATRRGAPGWVACATAQAARAAAESAGERWSGAESRLRKNVRCSTTKQRRDQAASARLCRAMRRATGRRTEATALSSTGMRASLTAEEATMQSSTQSTGVESSSAAAASPRSRSMAAVPSGLVA
mmetsp:Transcript_37390/g.120184  ORF Transcript_37390/g.120184 Transcript_37390/m.120184 type:complete len:230 (-) Transcript_37390:333-1022(-)